jgi:hypothetical protein
MSISRRGLVSLGSLLGGVAMLASAGREGTAAEPQAKDAPARFGQPATAKGTVASYSEGFQSSFSLTAMPEGVASFAIDERVAARLGRVLLIAAEKGWEVEVTYTRFPGPGKGGASAYYVTVKDFRSR